MKTMSRFFIQSTKTILKIFLLLFIYSPPAYSEIYKDLKVEGNERLSVETILMFSELNIKKDINKEDLNESIKKLYKTDYFKDIKIYSKNDVLIISIIENPIIQSIQIEGIKNKKLLEELKKITKKYEKYPYLKNKILNQNNLLLNIVRTADFILQIWRQI